MWIISLSKLLKTTGKMKKRQFLLWKIVSNFCLKTLASSQQRPSLNLIRNVFTRSSPASPSILRSTSNVSVHISLLALTKTWLESPWTITPNTWCPPARSPPWWAMFTTRCQIINRPISMVLPRVTTLSLWNTWSLKGSQTLSFWDKSGRVTNQCTQSMVTQASLSNPTWSF